MVNQLNSRFFFSTSAGLSKRELRGETGLLLCNLGSRNYREKKKPAGTVGVDKELKFPVMCAQSQSASSLSLSLGDLC